jgi:beta-glucosidase-like glycosyl hydrolase
VTAMPAAGARQSIEGVEAILRERLASLSLEQKVRLLTGADFWALHPEPAIGLRRLVVSDGPAGVRGERWDERDSSANVPSPTALAATWDEAHVERIGRLLAAESRRKGVDGSSLPQSTCTAPPTAAGTSNASARTPCSRPASASPTCAACRPVG